MTTWTKIKCYFGFHDWHDHSIYTHPVITHTANFGVPITKAVMDRVCLECLLEDNRAQRLETRRNARQERCAAAQRVLASKKTDKP